MNSRLIAGLVLFSTANALAASPTEALINYGTLTHTIRLAELRAGNHDDTGINDYYFAVKIYGLVSSQDEKKLDFAARKKILVDGGRFGDIHIAALSFWEKPEAGAPEVVIQGETFRDLAARTMKQFSVAETEVGILIEVEMYEQNKRFVFFGEDRLIGKTNFFLIPETFPHKPVTKDVSLTITDNLGTAVSLGVAFRLNGAEPEAPPATAGG